MADIDIMALGRTFDAAALAHTSMFDAGGDDDDPLVAAAGDLAGGLLERLITLPATNLDGLRVKARALAWTQGEDMTGKKPILAGPNDTTDRRVLASLMRDLLAPREAVQANQDDGTARDFRAACGRFDAAFTEWLRARADLSDRNHDESREAERGREDREVAAELALIATPAPHATAVWRKWALLEHLLTEEHEGGTSAYPLGMLAAAALKVDILALGLNPWPER